MLSSDDVRELREQLLEMKIEFTDRLARIETKLEQAGAARVGGDGSAVALGKVSTSLVELGKFLAQMLAAVIAALLAVKGGQP